MILWGSRDVRSSVVPRFVIRMVGGESVRGCGFRVPLPGKSLPMDDFMGAFVKASEPSAAASDLAEQSRRLRLVSHPASTVSIDLSIRSPTLTLTLP